MQTQHLTEDDLVLHYYGESGTADGHASLHLAACTACHDAYTRLQRVMAAIDSLPAPVLPESFEQAVWSRLEPALPASRGWLSGLALTPANFAWVAGVLVLVAGAFFAGRVTRPDPGGRVDIASSEAIRESVLLADVGEHLDRAQMILVELVSATPSDTPVDVAIERQRAEQLVAANRLYRQVAAQTGDVAISQLLDELERLLVELAASPDQRSATDVQRVNERVTATDLLFKVRVVSSAVRERQQKQVSTRARQIS